MKSMAIGFFFMVSFFGVCAEEDFLAKTGEAPVKTERELQYEQLFEKQLNDLLNKAAQKGRKPKIDGSCEFELVSGAKVEGTLVQLMDSRIVVQEKYGRVTYPVNVVEKKYWGVYFPKQAARSLVLRTLSEEAKRKAAEEAKRKALDDVKLTIVKAEFNTGKRVSQEQKLNGGNPESDAGKLKEASKTNDLALSAASVEELRKPKPPNRARTTCKYDTAPVSTSDELKTPLREFGKWLAYRAPEIASSVYAKRHGDSVAVYVKATPKYQQLDVDSKFSITEGMWNMWGFRCEDHRVASMTCSHLVIVDNSGKIIGGSSPNDPSNIWVDKK